jgi:hypothetical protein
VIADVAGLLVAVGLVALMGVFGYALLDELVLRDRRAGRQLQRSEDEAAATQLRAIDLLNERAVLLLEKALEDDRNWPTLSVTERAETEKLVADWRRDHPKKETPS